MVKHIIWWRNDTSRVNLKFILLTLSDWSVPDILQHDNIAKSSYRGILYDFNEFGSYLVNYLYILNIHIHESIHIANFLIYKSFNWTLCCDHSLVLIRRDDSNEGLIIGFGWKIRKLLWKLFCSYSLNAVGIMYQAFKFHFATFNQKVHQFDLGINLKVVTMTV